MAYSDFTLETLQSTFHITFTPQELFVNVEPCKPDDWLLRILEHGVSMAQRVGTEKAKSEFIIAPILLEARAMMGDTVSIFSGSEFNVDVSKGLNGFCDYLLSRSPNTLLIESPVMAIIEAKNDNLNTGIPQCIAAMLAAQLFNERYGIEHQSVFGAVTTGSLWRFFRLNGSILQIDTKDWSLGELERLLGMLVHILRDG